MSSFNILCAASGSYDGAFAARLCCLGARRARLALQPVLRLASTQRCEPLCDAMSFYFSTVLAHHGMQVGRSPRATAVRVVSLLLASIALTLPCSATPLSAAAEDRVIVAKIGGEIERGTAAYLRRAVREAQSATAIVLILDTPGGRVDAALEMRDALLDSSVPTIAFVRRNAYSAGALLALACEKIYFAPGGVIGAAAPVDGNTGKGAGEKAISAVRSAFAATAERRGRDRTIAEAMVDESVEIEGLIAAGKLLSLTADQALTHGISDGSAETLEALLKLITLEGASGSLEGATIERLGPGFAEKVAGFVTQPAVASILMSLGFLGLLFEIKTPGWGVGGSVALISLGLFFFGHQLAGLAGWEGVALVVLGVALLALELFVIPGFGIAGGLGLIAILGGLFMSMVDFNYPEFGAMTDAAGALAVTMVITLFAVLILLRYVPRMRLGGIVLRTEALSAPVDGDLQVPEATRLQLGEIGVALSDLRPAGVARFGDMRKDVVSEGDYIEAGTPLRIIRIDGYRIVVVPQP